MSNPATPSKTRDVATSASVRICESQPNRSEAIMPYISAEDIMVCPLPITSDVVHHDMAKNPAWERAKSVPRVRGIASLRGRFTRGKTCPNLDQLSTINVTNSEFYNHLATYKTISPS